MKKNRIQIFLLLGILLINIPLFFDIYRQCIFNIVPHDDYVPYLLHILGKGGSIPGSPTGYRFLSVAIAVPFYYLLPLFKFSLLEITNEDYIRGVEALSFVAYLASSFSAFFIYKITKDRLNSGETTALFAALIALLLFRFTAIYSIDPTAICMISILIYFFDARWIFAFLLFLSVGINEKITFLFLTLFGGRLLYNKFSTESFYLFVSIISFLTYFSIRKAFNLPGHEYMVDPSMFLEKANHTFKLLFTAKSVMLNWIPGGITFGLFFLALKAYKSSLTFNKLFFSPVDFLPIFALFIISLITDMQFTIGRILLFCFPLYLPLATINLTQYLKKITID